MKNIKGLWSPFAMIKIKNELIFAENVLFDEKCTPIVYSLNNYSINKINVTNNFEMSRGGMVFIQNLNKIIYFGGESDELGYTDLMFEVKLDLNNSYNWELMKVKMPIVNSDFGFCVIKDRFIIIIGGMVYKY